MYINYRSSFNENLHLMPNGFRRIKLERANLLLEDFKFRPHISTPRTRRSLRRGSMPINDYKRNSLSASILEINIRRGQCSLRPRNYRAVLISIFALFRAVHSQSCCS